jgi:hypothetical protein
MATRFNGQIPQTLHLDFIYFWDIVKLCPPILPMWHCLIQDKKNFHDKILLLSKGIFE